eukprot:scaffold243365_cov33-Tisochrysis_lutea.AAC.5
MAALRLRFASVASSHSVALPQFLQRFIADASWFVPLATSESFTVGVRPWATDGSETPRSLSTAGESSVPNWLCALRAGAVPACPSRSDGCGPSRKAGVSRWFCAWAAANGYDAAAEAQR